MAQAHIRQFDHKYLAQALWPLNPNSVPLRGRNQAKGRLLRCRTMPFPVEIHLSTKLAINPGIFTGHMIHHLGRARINYRVASGFH